MKILNVIVVLAVAVLTGCATSYSWRPKVPAEMRTVSVPSFRNESGLAEIGAVATRQVLREFQREGTFQIRAYGESAIEVQGVIKRVSLGAVGYNRRTWMRQTACELKLVAEVSVIDKGAGKVLVDNKTYTAQATTVAGQDQTTAERDASGRLADDLARQIVDDVLNLKW